MNALIKKYLPLVMLALFSCALPELAMAAGVDTGESSATAVQTWMNTWIPIVCAIAIVVSGLAWLAHLISFSFAMRLGVGLIVIGSASYIVSLFGVGS